MYYILNVTALFTNRLNGIAEVVSVQILKLGLFEMNFIPNGIALIVYRSDRLPLERYHRSRLPPKYYRRGPTLPKRSHTNRCPPKS